MTQSFSVREAAELVHLLRTHPTSLDAAIALHRTNIHGAEWVARRMQEEVANNQSANAVVYWLNDQRVQPDDIFAEWPIDPKLEAQIIKAKHECAIVTKRYVEAIEAVIEVADRFEASVPGSASIIIDYGTI